LSDVQSEREVAEAPLKEQLWVRVGGGLVKVPGGDRYGPADLESPPPGGPWKPLYLEQRLVGWASADADGRPAERAREAADRLLAERRAHLLGRLGHKLRSSVLALKESSRLAAYGRPELLEQIYDQAEEVGRRASALEVVALRPVDAPRSVVLGAVLNLAAPHANRELPGDAVVRGAEPALLEALARAYDWMGGAGSTIRGRRSGGWWRLELEASPDRVALVHPELGEPLVGYLVDAHLDGWLDNAKGGRAVIYLPAVS
jgi:hypothetical protein